MSATVLSSLTNTISGIKFQTIDDIPNLQLWLDASDENALRPTSQNVLTSTTPTWNFTTGSQASIDHNSSLEMGSEDFTLESWIKQADTNTDEKPIISKGFVSGVTFAQYRLGVTNVAFGTVGGGISYNQGIAGTTPIIPNKWYHLVFMRKSGILYLFVNGNLEGSATQSAYVANPNPLNIGWRSGAPSVYFRGDIASIRIIKGNALYPTNSFILNQTYFPSLLNTGSQTSLLAFQTNPTIQDYSNYNHNITLTNVTTANQTVSADIITPLAWLDKSPNALTASQPIINNQSTLLSAEINGLNVLNFDGINHFLTLSTPITTNINYSQFFVFNRRQNNIVSTSLGTGTGSLRNYSFLWWNLDNRLYSYTLPTNQYRGTAAISASGTHISSIVQSIPRNTVDFYLDNGFRTISLADISPNQNLTANEIGRSGSSGLSYFHKGMIGEIIQMAFEAPPYEINLINQKLFDKWKVPKIPPYNKISQIIFATSVSALSSTLGTWAVEPTGFNVQWQRSNDNTIYTNIPNASSVVYNPTTADYGFFVRTSISASNAVGMSLPSFSNVLQLTTQNITPVTLQRTTIFTVSATGGTWISTMPLTYFYQYQVNTGNGWQNFGTLTTSTTAYLSAYETTPVDVRVREYAYNSTLELI